MYIMHNAHIHIHYIFIYIKNEAQLISMEQTYQPMQWMLKGFFQSPDDAHGVSCVHICAVTPYNLYVLFAFTSFRLATNDLVMSLLEPDCGVVWLKYEEPGSATMLMCSSERVFLRKFYSFEKMKML